MGLKGTLADVGAVDLVQFAHTGRKTGSLRIAGPAGDAQLFYEKGQLVHAQLDGKQGLDVLVDVLDWSDADFEFLPGVPSTDRSIHVDLPRAVMYALKIRDERAAENKEQGGDASWFSPEERLTQAIAAQISHFVASTPHTQYVCVLEEDGRQVAESGSTGGSVTELDAMRQKVVSAISGYPRKGWSRLFFTDEDGTVAAGRLRDGRTLMVVADAKASLGSVSVAIGRLVSLIV